MVDPRAPYPASPLAAGWKIHEPRRSVGNGDNWAITWADDGHQYCYPTDTKGFEDAPHDEVSSVPVVVRGDAPGFEAEEVESPTGTLAFHGPKRSQKVSGLLMVGGVLHAWVRNLNLPGTPEGTGSTLMVSRDRARTWERVGWNLPQIGYATWMNAGRNHAAARDGFAYFVAPDGPGAYADSPDVLLGRVPVDAMTDLTAYRFFGGLDGAGEPLFGPYDRRRPALSDPAGCFRTDLVYNPGLDRYLLLSCSPSGDWSDWWSNDNPDRVPHLGVFESENPWGPWRTVAWEPDWGAPENRFTPHVPPKWISADGREFWLLYSCIPIGPYRFNVQRVTL